jgi:hypothetical protein
MVQIYICWYKYIFVRWYRPINPIIENEASDGSSLKQRKDACSLAEGFGAEQLKILSPNLRRTAEKTVAEENVSGWYLSLTQT